MRFRTLVVAGAIGLTGIAPVLAAPAAAQRTVVTERTVVRDSHDRHAAESRRVCHWETRHHHRVRVCRTVRYR